MYALAPFRRRLYHGDQQRDVEIAEGFVGWVPAQRHAGENIGETPSHSIFVELKGGQPDPATGQLGPS
jgi:hypothetical protein